MVELHDVKGDNAAKEARAEEEGAEEEGADPGGLDPALAALNDRFNMIEGAVAAGEAAAEAEAAEAAAERAAAVDVGRCRLPVSEPMLKAPEVSVLEAII
jgi:hypothetical protein